MRINQNRGSELGTWARTQAQQILENERWDYPRSGTVAQFRYTGFGQWGTWASTQANKFWQMNFLGFKSKHRATIYLYWIFEDDKKQNGGSELGTGAGTQSQQLRQINNWLPKIRHCGTI